MTRGGAAVAQNTDGEKLASEHIELADIAACETSDETMWQALRANPRVVVCALLVNLGTLLYGYDIIVSGAIVALPGFLKVYGDDIDGYVGIPALWQGLWQAFINIGVMVGVELQALCEDSH